MTDKLSVYFLNVYGTEKDIINAARVSHNSVGDDQSNQNLIKYLIKNKHFTPLRWAHIDMRITMPIFCCRQFMRHNTGMDFVEVSARYTEPTTYYTPDRVSKDVQAYMQEVNDASFAAYNKLLEQGVSKELARTVLPVATMSTVAVNVNLQELLHVLTLRLDKHAQAELRIIARMILEKLEPYFPNIVSEYKRLYLSGENYDI